MMMRGCVAGGMKAHHTVSRETKNRRIGAYIPNREGLYEFDTAEMFKPGWSREHDGCVIKVMGFFLGLLSAHEYRVCFMRRDPEEIRQSARAAFGDNVTLAQIERDTEEAQRTLCNRRDVKEVTTLWYSGDVLASPVAAFERLGWPLNAAKAAAVVDPGQYRFRRERLVVGL